MKIGQSLPHRIAALDVARGLAVMGMFVAHVSAYPNEQDIGAWIKSIADGRSSILFATLAGISLAILTGRQHVYTGVAFLQAKTRIFTRAALLLVLSGILSLMNSVVVLILAFYAAWFVAAIPFLRMRTRNLFIAAGVFWLVGPIVSTYGVALFENLGMSTKWDASNFTNEVFLTGTYVGVVYMGFVLAGLAIGRLDLSSRVVASYLASIGASMAIVGYGSAFLIDKFFKPWYYDPNEFGGYPGFYDEMSSGFRWPEHPLWPHYSELLTADPHSGTTLEAIGSGGFAISLIGFLLLAGPIIGKILYPIAAVGSMSLTAYSAHVIAIFQISGLQESVDDWPLLWLILSIMAGCTLWRLLFGRGPLERFMTWASKRAARIDGPPQVLGDPRAAGYPAPSPLHLPAAEPPVVTHSNPDVASATVLSPATVDAPTDSIVSPERPEERSDSQD